MVPSLEMATWPPAHNDTTAARYREMGPAPPPVLAENNSVKSLMITILFERTGMILTGTIVSFKSWYRYFRSYSLISVITRG